MNYSLCFHVTYHNAPLILHNLQKMECLPKLNYFMTELFHLQNDSKYMYLNLLLKKGITKNMVHVQVCVHAALSMAFHTHLHTVYHHANWIVGVVLPVS